MSTKRANLIIIICLLLGILLLGCASTNMMTPQTLKYPREARRSLDITIDVSQRQKFFDQLKKFADKHAFTILIDTRSSGPEDFLISITGGDIEIDGDNVFAPGEYGFGFYDANRQHPEPESAFDDLINDLKSFISEVPDATFSVKK